MSELRPHQFKNYTIIIGGSTIEGFSKTQTPLSIEYESERASVQAGADGYVITSHFNDYIAMITLNLLANSPSNSYLNKLFDLPQRAGVVIPTPFSFRDSQNIETHFSSSLVLISMPTFTYNESAEDRTWVFKAPYLASKIE